MWMYWGFVRSQVAGITRVSYLLFWAWFLTKTGPGTSYNGTDFLGVTFLLSLSYGVVAVQSKDLMECKASGKTHSDWFIFLECKVTSMAFHSVALPCGLYWLIFEVATPLLRKYCFISEDIKLFALSISIISGMPNIENRLL